MERWVEAIKMSRKTAHERLYSITKQNRNIYRILQLFESGRAELKDEVEHSVLDALNAVTSSSPLQDLLATCQTITEDLIQASPSTLYCADLRRMPGAGPRPARHHKGTVRKR